MISENKNSVFKVEDAGSLNLALRKLVHNPRKILKPLIRRGMTALDFGCGPGFFTLELARLVGAEGKVVAADLQEGMLEILKTKFHHDNRVNNVIPHLCSGERTGLSEKFDFILAFYVMHELTDQSAFLDEVHDLLKPEGMMLIAEPKFRVSDRDFASLKDKLRTKGFHFSIGPELFLSRSLLVTLR